MHKDTKKEDIKSKKKLKDIKLPKHLEHINKMAAGIDIGSKSHFVAVPEGSDEVCVREFKSFTPDLNELADWLKKCGVTTIAMESTGVYWIPLYELLESRGFEVLLTDARHVRNVSGRKTDVLDCQWLQQLHTYGLLTGAFRPNEQICALRAYMRQRNMLIQQASSHVQHMQKALSQMNIQLHNVISDITGETGLRIIRAIVAGERNPKQLALNRDRRCKSTLEVIEKSLTGHYREEHIFSLSQALELYDTYQNKITTCDEKILQQLSIFEHQKNIDAAGLKEKMATLRSKKTSKNAPKFNLKLHLFQISGVDLTLIPGLDSYSILKIIAEIGLDLSRWKSSKQFASWLGLCPGNKVSGGKRLSSKSKRTANYATTAFRMAASTLHHSQSALGAFYRRLKSRLGAPKAITAAAHKLAVIFFCMLKNHIEYIETGQDYYEKQYRDRLINNLSRRAKMLGFELIETPLVSNG
jgi:transposase